MSYNFTLSAVLRGRWLLERQWAEAHIPVVLSMLKGNPVSFVERSGNQSVEQPFAVDPKTMQRYNWMDGRNPNIPEGSVGVIPISGPITKYNGDCGEPGAIQRNNWLLQMEKRQNISSTVLLMDTPGGEARAANSTVKILTNYSKPVLSSIDGMSASLGMWYTSGTDEVYVNSPMDEVGSVGSYLTLFDFRGMLEKEGIKMHEIYAPQSVDKNKDYKDALNGEYAAIEKDLELHVNDFIKFISQQRPKAAATQNQWSSGKMFYAADAQKLGLIDGVKDFTQVIGKASWLGKRNK